MCCEKWPSMLDLHLVNPCRTVTKGQTNNFSAGPFINVLKSHLILWQWVWWSFYACLIYIGHLKAEKGQRVISGQQAKVHHFLLQFRAIFLVSVNHRHVPCGPLLSAAPSSACLTAPLLIPFPFTNICYPTGEVQDRLIMTFGCHTHHFHSMIMYESF